MAPVGLSKLYILIIINNIYTVSAKIAQGPYRTIVTDVTLCDPDQRETQASGGNKVEMYPQVTSSGTMLIQGKVTVEDFKDVKMSAIVYRRGKHKIFEARNMNCHNTVVDIIYTSMHLPINKKTCNVAPGSYKFADVDVNKCLHKFIQSVTYGNFTFRIEIFKMRKTEQALIGCNNVMGEHVPVTA